MKSKLIALAAVAGFAITAPAQAFVVDLEGVTADGAGVQSFTVSNANTAAVIDVDFNFIYEAGECDVCGDPPGSGNPSWGSELILEVFHVGTGEAGQIGTAAESCTAFGLICEVDLGWDDTSGIFTASGNFSFANPIADGSGDWIITTGDSFDDAGIDGAFLAGSHVTVNQVAAAVPVPATLALIGLGLVGFGVARRRS